MKTTILALCLAVLAGCSRSEAHSRSFQFFEINGKSEASAIIDGVALEFDSSVRVHFGLDIGVMEISNDSDPSEVWTVNEHPFGLADGELFIGERRYGEVRSGDLVAVSADGVRVNGEPRGTLP